MTRFRLSCLPLNTSSSVPLLFFRAKVFCSPSSFGRKKEGSGTAYYITAGCFRGFDPRQNLSSARNALGKFFLETLFMQNYAKFEFGWTKLGWVWVFCCVLTGVF
jgi:hypothetical protein